MEDKNIMIFIKRHSGQSLLVSLTDFAQMVNMDNGNPEGGYKV